ncbi:ABC transporter transmembrane domain-containing protein [Marivirga salinae]|uniref:ABC transporter transmembrane domain-containing protein n=1 Tax=Marivirga salinarum TaxID=3059078 RepID=A0AA51NBR7_9BACT|nr:ABC transporter transmembrane domain-containing protein [Marivirga sp. BDSF4-3]WMN12364.1 ABC transporter transmembrane domain-containing protein [Marivirga sp. BDSF4-3]
MAKRRKSEPLNEEEKKPLNKENFKKLTGVFQFIKPYKGYFIAGLFFLLISSTTLLALPYVMGKIVDVAQGRTSGVFTGINRVALILIGILAVQSFFSFFRVYLFAQVSERAMADVRAKLYTKLMSLPMTFYDKSRVGELVSRITSDVSLLQDTFSITLAEFIRQVSTLIIGAGIIFYFTPKLAAFMIATFPVLVIAAMVFGKFIRKLSKKTQSELASANIIVEETLQSINIVKAFTSELLEVMRYRKSLDKVVKVALKSATFRGAFISFIIFAMFGGIVAVLWYGATLVQEGTMTVGDLLSFVLYTTFIGASIAGLGDLYGQIQKAIGASERVMEILQEEEEFKIEEKEKIHLQGAIQFEDVKFSYPTRKDVQVLKGLNLTVGAGEKVALVGHSGAGKSTIIQLLMRFYPLASGQIKVDDQNIESLSITGYRQNIGIVPQEIILFGGSIRENIAYGKPNASDEEIIAAAEKANAWLFIKDFPEGLDTLVGERGVKLSGGQRQRIAIARAILKDPKILILDEATSSLDAESENLVQQALDELMKDRTTIIIAHRLATIRKVDKIFVLKEGQISEQGSHQELLESENGTYSNLVKLQLQD